MFAYTFISYFTESFDTNQPVATPKSYTLNTEVEI